jgi:hypothetical protein
MVAGAFARFDHDHYFREIPEGCLVQDRFDFDAPFGLLGNLANKFFLVSYMQRFLEERNAVVRRVAESQEWQRYIKDAWSILQRS